MASIDVGSNTIRMMVAEAGDEKITPLLSRKIMTRLAAGIHRTGRLKGAAMESSLQVLREYADLIGSREVARLRAVATSALRDAENSHDFILRAGQETGLDLKIISGEEESMLTAMGVMSAVPDAHDGLVLDIGGGSTELAYLAGGEVRKKCSLPLGVVKLLERHITMDPPAREEIRSVERESEQAAMELEGKFELHTTAGTTLIGTGGTATTLAALDLGLGRYDPKRVHRHAIPLKRLQALCVKMASMTVDERAGLDGLEPARADLIMPGIIFTIKLMEVLGFRRFIVSDSGLLEGILAGLSKEASK